MPQEIGEIYKTLVPTLSDDASVEEAFQMYHYGTASYNGNNLQPQSIERHLINLNENVARIDQVIAGLANVYIEEQSSNQRPNIIRSQDSTTIPLTIHGSVGQSVPLQRWRKNSGTNQFTDSALINNNGEAAFGGYLSVGNATAPSSQSVLTGLSVSLSGDDIGVTVRGVVGQTKNLQEWQNSLGSSLARISSLGDFYGVSVNVSDVVSTNEISGPSATITNIEADKITLTGLASIDAVGTLIVGGESTFNDDVTITGTTTSVKSLSIDGATTSTGSISANGSISAGGALSGASLSLSGAISATNVTATGIVTAKSPNQGTTGAVRIIADANELGFLQFVNSASTTELVNMRASSGALRTNGELVSTSANAFRMVNGSYGTFFRNDGTNTYLLMTNANDQYGAFNDLRPMTIAHNTGYMTVRSPIGSGTSGVRNIHISTGDPNNAVGANGDLWIKYV